MGTSGYVYRHWRGVFYPERLPAADWLPYYARHLDTVEMNATFYRLPSPEAVDAWRARVGPRFRFACKGSRFLTHMKRLLDTGRGVKRYYAPVRRLGSHLEVVLWQLPPQMQRPDAGRLDAFLAAQPRDVRQAVEFRHEAWHEPGIWRVLERHGAALCEHDLLPRPSSRPEAPFRYLRFHGRGARYAGRYGRPALEPWARELAKWRDDGRDAYVYFNNDGGGAAVQDALDLAGLLAPRSQKRPAQTEQALHTAGGSCARPPR